MKRRADVVGSLYVGFVSILTSNGLARAEVGRSESSVRVLICFLVDLAEQIG
jgi:hypothetical protein